MPKCRDCGAVVAFLRKPGGVSYGKSAWLPPVEPVLDFADGEYLVMSPTGEAIPLPQIFKRHRCPQEAGADPEDLADRRAQRQIEKLDREAERERMLEEATFRRDLLAREQRTALEAERIAADIAHQNQRDAINAQQEALQQAFIEEQQEEARLALGERIGSVECPRCNAALGEPCRSTVKRPPGSPYLMTPHPERRKAAPPPPLRPQKRRWGDDYEGPWPPVEQDDPVGWRIMRRWLTNNGDLFSQSPDQVATPVQKEMEDGPSAEPGRSDPAQEEVAEVRRPATPDFIQPQC